MTPALGTSWSHLMALSPCAVVFVALLVALCRSPRRSP